jgi:hypothetical protein
MIAFKILGLSDENMRLPINDHIEKLNDFIDSMETVSKRSLPYVLGTIGVP